MCYVLRVEMIFKYIKKYLRFFGLKVGFEKILHVKLLLVELENERNNNFKYKKRNDDSNNIM